MGGDVNDSIDRVRIRVFLNSISNKEKIMDLKPGELQVFFNVKHMRGKERLSIENKITALMKKFGYSKWA